MSEPGVGETHRLQGTIEKKDPTIKPLEPTPITPDARARFESWGVPETFITRLQELTSSMRYDLCSQKAERISQNGGYIYSTPDGKEEVILPNFLNLENSLDGHCGDVAVQLLKHLHSTNYLDDLNTHLEKQGKPKVMPWFLNGQSQTHFNQSGNIHIYLGLLPEGSLQEDLITVDPSFQEISNIDSNGYSIDQKMINPRSIEGFSTAGDFFVGKYDEDENLRIQFSIPHQTVLGLSSDRSLIYTLGFVKNSHDGTIRPTITILFPNGENPFTVFVGNDGRIVEGGRNENVQAAHMEEVRTILGSLSSMSLVRDQAKATELKDTKVSIKFGAN